MNDQTPDDQMPGDQMPGDQNDHPEPAAPGPKPDYPGSAGPRWRPMNAREITQAEDAPERAKAEEPFNPHDFPRFDLGLIPWSGGQISPRHMITALTGLAYELGRSGSPRSRQWSGLLYRLLPLFQEDYRGLMSTLAYIVYELPGFYEWNVRQGMADEIRDPETLAALGLDAQVKAKGGMDGQDERCGGDPPEEV